MQNRYGYFQRANGVYYALDLVSQRQTSLKTREEAEAKRLIAAKNQAADTPQLNRAMAKVYASAASPQLMERTWREVIDAYVNKSVPTTRPRVARAFRSEPFKVLGRIKVNETDPTGFWAVLNHKKAGNSTNHYLPRVQNFAWGMRWLFDPVMGAGRCEDCCLRVGPEGLIANGIDRCLHHDQGLGRFEIADREPCFLLFANGEEKARALGGGPNGGAADFPLETAMGETYMSLLRPGFRE